MDITVIKILIVCATLIALAAIVCDFWVEKKTAETPERPWPNKIIKIHRNYIAGFLGFGIIMLLTAQYGGTCEDLLTYLSFGSTLTSLVLSVLAIFVTVRSSFDLYKQYGTIKQVSEQIGESLRNLKTSETNIGKASSDISTQMERIVDEIVKRIYKRIDKNEMTMRDLLDKNYTNTVSQGNNSQGKNQGEINKNNFLKESSTFGLYGLYACVLSKEKNMSFELSDIFTEFGDQVYAFGFLVAISSMGLLQFKDLRQFNTPLIVKNIYFDKIELLTEIRKRINREKKNDNKNLLINLVNDINDFFEEEHLEVEQ